MACGRADVVRDALREVQSHAIQPGRVTGHRDGDHHRACGPERREQREPGKDAERGKNRVPADV
jgi:hypothetical protein